MKRVAYSLETKNKAIEMKIEGYSIKEIMDTLNIRNMSQVKTWWRWYKKGENHRFQQQVGKQYSYGKGIEELNNEEKLIFLCLFYFSCFFTLTLNVFFHSMFIRCK